MARVQDDPALRCLRIPEWPDLDQRHWHAILRRGELLDDDGRAADWSPATILKHRKGYDRWLGWLIENNDLDPLESPWQRVTPNPVRCYVEDLRKRTAPARGSRRGEC